MATRTLLDRYELIRLIGAGGMAQVWEGRDAVLERTVAVKTVDLSGSTDPTLGERLQREAVSTATLAHPDIVTVHDAGVEGDTAFFVMELLEGSDLATTLRGGPLPIHDVARIGARVAGALAAAHQAGIVHRDIKPGNVLVNGDQVTVVDFGIATVARAAQATMTAPGTVLGTPQYISPEQVQGRPATPASDMYSTGCLLMALATGSGPFVGDDALAVLHQHIAEAPPRMVDRRPDVPAELDDLVGRLLDKDPAARPTAVQTRDALRRLAVATPETAAATVAMTMAPTLAMPVGVGAVGLGAAGLAAAGLAAAAAPPVIPVPPAESGASPPRSDEPRRRRKLPLALGAAAALVVAVIAIALSTGGPQDPTAEASEPVVGESAEAQEEAPAEDPAPPPPAADDFVGLLAGMPVDEASRTDLLSRYQEVADAAASGNTKTMGEKLVELSDRIDELIDDEALTQADGDVLRAALVAAHGEIPAGDDDDEGKGSGKGKDD